MTNARVIINLTSVGGGTIELTEQDNVDDLDTGTGDTGTDAIDDTARSQELNVYDADNPMTVSSSSD